VRVVSILSMVAGRLGQLRRVIRGEEDPARIWAPHNAGTLTGSLADFDGDIILFAWKARGMPLVLARPSAWGVEPQEKRSGRRWARRPQGGRAGRPPRSARRRSRGDPQRGRRL